MPINVTSTKIYVTLIKCKGFLYVTLISCAPEPGRILLVAMDDEPWQQRAKRAGLTQKRLAALLGVAPNTVSRQLRGQFGDGVPTYVKSFIRAWEMLPQADRERLDRAVESEEE